MSSMIGSIAGQSPPARSAPCHRLRRRPRIRNRLRLSPSWIWGRAPFAWPSPRSPRRTSASARRSVEGRPAGPRHVLLGSHPLADARRRDRRARRLPSDHGRLRRDPVRAVATSAVREARNGEIFLDRVQGRTGITFEIINEAEESRLVYLAVAATSLQRHPAFSGAWTLLAEVGGGSTSLTLLRRGEPNRSGVYALGAVRLRQQLDLRRHSHDVQVGAAQARTSRTSSRKSGSRSRCSASRRWSRSAATCGSRPHRSMRGERRRQRRARSPRDAFLAFCDEVERLDEDSLVERFRLPAVEAETLMPALLVYSHAARRNRRRAASSSPTRRCGRACCSISPSRAAGSVPRTSSARCWPAPKRSANAIASTGTHGHHVAMLADRLFDELRDEHGLADRERLLLQVGGAAARRRHLRQPARAPQALAVPPRRIADLRAVRRRNRRSSSNIARYHRRGLPQRSHLPVHRARSRRPADRQQAGGDPARRQRARRRAPAEGAGVRARARRASTWMLELEGTGDLTMEQTRGHGARRHVRRDVRPAAASSGCGSGVMSRAGHRHSAVHQPRAVVAGVQRARARRGGRSDRRRCSSASSSPRSPRRTSMSSSWSAWRRFAMTNRGR